MFLYSDRTDFLKFTTMKSTRIPLNPCAFYKPKIQFGYTSFSHRANVCDNTTTTKLASHRNMRAVHVQKSELSWFSGNRFSPSTKLASGRFNTGRHKRVELVGSVVCPEWSVFPSISPAFLFSQNQQLRKANGSTKMTYERIILMTLRKQLRSSQS